MGGRGVLQVSVEGVGIEEGSVGDSVGQKSENQRARSSAEVESLGLEGSVGGFGK